MPEQVFLVIHDYPHIYMEVERVFVSSEKAHAYIEEVYEHFEWHDKDAVYIWEGADQEHLEDEERYYVMAKPVED